MRIPQPYKKELKKEIKKHQKDIHTQVRRLNKALVESIFRN